MIEGEKGYLPPGPEGLPSLGLFFANTRLNGTDFLRDLLPNNFFLQSQGLFGEELFLQGCVSLEGLVREVWTKIDLHPAAITLIFVCGGGGQWACDRQ